MPDDVTDASPDVEPLETQPEEQEGAEQDAQDEMVRVPRKELETLIQRIEGFKKTQSTLSKKEQDYQNTIQGLQVLSKFRELSQEEQQGHTNLAEMSREMATVVGKAFGLSGSDVRYLSTLPWRQIRVEAERIAGENATNGGDDEDLRAKYFGTPTKKGSAGAKLPETRGQRVNRGGYKNLEAALDAAMNMSPDKARELLQQHGISV